MDPLDTLTSTLPPLFAEHAFKPISLGVERHGSWEWSFLKHRDGLNRFVIVALTDVPSGAPDGGVYGLEVRAGADDERSFVKHLVVDRRLRANEFAAQGRLPANLKSEIERGISVAEKINESQLAESYLPAG